MDVWICYQRELAKSMEREARVPNEAFYPRIRLWSGEYHLPETCQRNLNNAKHLVYPAERFSCREQINSQHLLLTAPRRIVKPGEK